MAHRSKYAFMPVPELPNRSVRLDFSEARKLVATLFREPQLEAMYDRREVPLSREQFPIEHFRDLPPRDKHYIAWLFAGPVILDGLALAKFSSYLHDPVSGILMMVPTEYWKQAGLDYPVDSRIQILASLFYDASVYASAPLFLVQQDLAAAFSSTPKARAGRQPKYDWEGFANHLGDLLVDRGMPMVGDPGWSSQSDVETEMARWCLSAWGQEPSPSVIRHYVKQSLNKFSAERTG
ncbi:hypothetical protein JHC09_15955 [Devosia sp. MC532]|uniref:hypothetical protein n=1 Tax=Devosia sp. MC532 TaxID=2799788 RepID=UPI0018F4924F|nr:hypothetical protein [Devosia sp. MC532]MBJ7579369.1 hypothetical protein [Devosia sp. MC532]